MLNSFQSPNFDVSAFLCGNGAASLAATSVQDPKSIFGVIAQMRAFAISITTPKRKIRNGISPIILSLKRQR